MTKAQIYEKEKRKYTQQLQSGVITWKEYERLIRELCRRIRY